MPQVERLKEASHKKDPILKKHVGLIHSENKLSLLQRKICNILLFNALNDIHEDVHQISLRQLCSLIGYLSNDVSLIKNSLKRLMSTVMEWNLLNDVKFINDKELPTDLISWHASTLLAGASIEEGLLRYSYSPQIKAVLSSIEIYGQINLFVQSKFNSSYSLVLYENCVRFKNIGKTAWLELKLFRALMGVAQQKYPEFKELKRNVITPAVTEINKKSDISVATEFRKMGRQVTAIRFLIFNNENYRPHFRHGASIKDNGLIYDVSMVDEVLKTEFNVETQLIAQIMQQYETSYILEKINFVKKQKSVSNKTAYFIAALKNDYQESKNLSDKTTSVEATYHYLRESREADKISGLHKKYMSYRLNIFKSWLDNHADHQKIYLDFKDHLSSNQIISDLYRKKGLNTPMVNVEFINFLDKYYQSQLPRCLSLEDYITEEEPV